MGVAQLPQSNRSCVAMSCFGKIAHLTMLRAWPTTRRNFVALQISSFETCHGRELLFGGAYTTRSLSWISDGFCVARPCESTMKTGSLQGSGIRMRTEQHDRCIPLIPCGAEYLGQRRLVRFEISRISLASTRVIISFVKYWHYLDQKDL